MALKLVKCQSHIVLLAYELMYVVNGTTAEIISGLETAASLLAALQSLSLKTLKTAMLVLVCLRFFSCSPLKCFFLIMTVVFFALIALAVGQLVPVPNQADYQQVITMTTCCYQGHEPVYLKTGGILPWPHSYGTRKFKYYSWSDLAAKGQTFYSNVPSSQNATLLAAVVYDWLLPRYRIPNWYLTATSGRAPQSLNNYTALNQLFLETYMSVDYQHPYMDEAFKIDVSSFSAREVAIQNTFPAISLFCSAEANILKYAATQLPREPYSVHPTLYRGSREVEFFCNRFNANYGLSVDDCVQAYMQPGSTICVNVFWSTTPRQSYISRYTGVATFTVAQNSTRSDWWGSPIGQLTGYADEYLYVPGSCFSVQSVTCSAASGTNLWAFQITEMGLGKQPPLKPFNQIDTSAFQQCVSSNTVSRPYFEDSVPERLTRFF